MQARGGSGRGGVETPEGAWRTTAAFRRALLLGAGGVVVGVAAGSVELVLLGVPLLLCVVLACRPRPDLGSAPTLVRSARTAAVGEPLPVTVEVTGAPAAAGAELVVVRTPTATVGVAPTARRRGLVGTTVPTTWGRRTVARPDALCVSHDGMLAVGPVTGPVRDLLVVPALTPAAAGPLPPHTTSVVGRHLTRRVGAGSDLHAVDTFRPGDRLRHVDWRATARRGRGPAGLELYVRRAVVEAEGLLVLLLDTRGDLDTDVGSWSVPRERLGGALGAGSSLDLTVTTATALAAAHLQAGDRVGTVDLTVPGAAVPPGAGRRHLHRLRVALAGTTATGQAAGQRPPSPSEVVLPRRLLQHVPARALAVVLSPFLDDRVSDLALALQRHGRTTMGVDCLPAGLVPDATSPVGAQALALVLAERDRRLARLAEAGVAVLPAGADLATATRRLVRTRERAVR